LGGRKNMDQFIERLSRMDSCAVSDALDKLGLPGSVTGIPRVSTDYRIAGRVLTVKLDRAEGRSSTRHLCTTAIEAASSGDIIVCEQRTGLDAACWGGNLTIAAKARSPKPATPTRAAPSSKAPGLTGIQRKSVVTSNCGWKRCPKPSRILVGRPKCGSANAIDN